MAFTIDIPVKSYKIFLLGVFSPNRSNLHKIESYGRNLAEYFQ